MVTIFEETALGNFPPMDPSKQDYTISTVVDPTPSREIVKAADINLEEEKD